MKQQTDQCAVSLVLLVAAAALSMGLTVDGGAMLLVTAPRSTQQSATAAERQCVGKWLNCLTHAARQFQGNPQPMAQTIQDTTIEPAVVCQVIHPAHRHAVLYTTPLARHLTNLPPPIL